MNVRTKFEVRNFTRYYPNNLDRNWIRPRSRFSKIFNGLLFGWTLWIYWPNLKSRDNSDSTFGRGLRTSNLGKGGAQGVGNGTVRRSTIHSDLSSVFTRFRDIAAFMLQHATFPTPFLVSPKFPHVSLGVGGWPFGYEEQRRWANCPCN